MGWTGMHKSSFEPRGKEWLRKRFEHASTERGEWKILADALVARTEYYAVMRRTTPAGEVSHFGLVVMVQWTRGHYNVHYKDMDDGMGPVIARCPLHIVDMLDRLAPVSGYPVGADGEGARTWAAGWRARCRQYHVARAGGKEPRKT